MPRLGVADFEVSLFARLRDPVYRMDEEKTKRELVAWAKAVALRAFLSSGQPSRG